MVVIAQSTSPFATQQLWIGVLQQLRSCSYRRARQSTESSQSIRQNQPSMPFISAEVEHNASVVIDNATSIARLEPNIEPADIDGAGDGNIESEREDRGSVGVASRANQVVDHSISVEVLIAPPPISKYGLSGT